MPMFRVLIRDADPDPEAITVPPRALRAVTQIVGGLTALLRALDVAEERLRAYESPEGRLTPREWEVLRLLTEGQPNAGIGPRPHISLHPVRAHPEHPAQTGRPQPPGSRRMGPAERSGTREDYAKNSPSLPKESTAP